MIPTNQKRMGNGHNVKFTFKEGATPKRTTYFVAVDTNGKAIGDVFPNLAEFVNAYNISQMQQFNWKVKKIINEEYEINDIIEVVQ